MAETAKNPVNSKAGWKQNPEAVCRDILRVAISEFAKSGLSGARIDDIAAQTKTSKRMIYYYFTDKETLYARALEAAYAKVRDGEAELDLAGFAPDAALARLVAFTFDHHRKHPDFIRMVMIENIHHAEHMKRSDISRGVNLRAIEQLADIIARGQSAGIFRADLDPVELHWHISALSFFNVANRPTFSALFGNSLFSQKGQKALREHAVDMILRYVAPTEET